MTTNGTEATKISVQPGKGFKKFCGGKTFYLGHDEIIARSLAAAIVADWREWKEKFENWRDSWGDKPERLEWNEVHLQRIDRRKGIAYGEIVEEPTVAPGWEDIKARQGKRQAPAAAVGSLADAVTAFKEIVKASGKRSPGWRRVMLCRLDKLGLSGQLSDFGHDEIAAKVDEWIGFAKAGTYSADSAKGSIKVLRQFVDWLDATDKLNWQAPRRWEKLFAVSAKSLTTGKALNKKLGERLTFAVEELQRLYQSANKRGRALLLLALNLGWSQTDIATLTPEMVNLKSETIERYRNKTGVYCRWALWPETIDALRSLKVKRGEPLFLTQDGKPLVWHKENGQRIDSVQQWFTRLAERSNVEGAFKMLRKTSSQAIRDIGGKDLAEVFLAHTEKGVVTNSSGGNAYNEFADWIRLDIAIASMRARLDKMFQPLPKAKTKKAK